MKNKVNPIMEMIRQQTPPEVEKQVDLCVAVANRVYELLEERGMSQRDFARALGKTETEVSRWLSGTHNLTIATIAKMSVALNDDIIVTTASQKHDSNCYQVTESSLTMAAEGNAAYGK